MTESQPADASVSRWIEAFRHGDESYAANLWAYLRRRLFRLARDNVRPSGGVAYDEEDVALSAFGALCLAFRDGRYQEVSDRTQLWKLVTVITANKARDRVRYENCERRGGRVRGVDDPAVFLQSLISDEPDPEMTLVIQEECARLLELLEQREVQQVALLKVEGFTNEEIAEQLGCTRRSVQRRLALIREIWAEELR